MGMNIKDEELVKMFNPILKMRETILFFLIVMINGLTLILSEIELDTCAKEMKSGGTRLLRLLMNSGTLQPFCCLNH